MPKPLPSDRTPRYLVSCDERRRFPPAVSSPAAARRFVTDCIADPDLARRAALLVSELATNAVVHAKTPFEVRVRVAASTRVEVTDHSSAALRVGPSPESEHGRGLRVVQAIASTWGVEDAPPGKRVWFELADPDGPSTTGMRPAVAFGRPVGPARPSDHRPHRVKRGGPG